MTQDAKLLAGVGLATLLIIIVGVFFLSKNETQTKGSPVDEKILLGNSRHRIEGTNANVRLVEFADFQCPGCKAAHPIVKQVLEKYKGKMTFIYRHFPLPQHKNAVLAAKASEAATEAGKFWEMSDLLYINQNDWSGSDNPQSLFTTYAQKLNLETDAFIKKIQSNQFDQMIQEDQSDGITLGVRSTPTFFLNGKKLQLVSFADLLGEVGNAINASAK